MKRSLSLLLCIMAIVQGTNAANIVEQSDSTKRYISENLVKQSSFDDYRKYIGCRLDAINNTVLYVLDMQTSRLPRNSIYMTYSEKKKSRTFYFDKIKTMVYKPYIDDVKKVIATNNACYYYKFDIASHIQGESFEIVDIIKYDEFNNVVFSFNEIAINDFYTKWHEIQNLKVKKKQLLADKEPQPIYIKAQPDIPNIPEQDIPVFVLKDKDNKECYWIPNLTSTAYNMKEAFVFTPYIDYLKHSYVGRTYYYKDSGKHFTINAIVINQSGDICIKNNIENDMTFRSFSSVIREKKLLTKSEYADYIAEQERQRQLEEERRKEEERIAEEKRKQEERAAELKKQEEERQKKLEEQRKKQELVRKYGAHYAECIINETLEIGMPIAVVKEILPIMKRTSRNVTRYETTERYEAMSAASLGIGFVADLFGLGGLAEYSGLTKTYYLTFTNGKLTSYYD